MLKTGQNEKFHVFEETYIQEINVRLSEFFKTW